ncbi:FMN-binding protein [Vibrio sp. SS-MA-C1-2]|uniref:FMN-binding protein n=1 Tax=Vibrio sp. SS-MA-C1-2 TaxID=2908646 RepID=UPI001F3B1FF7|nr:FMN-binding protein [Vibrio sp. SS-MA-C1-2]UJF17274.1 FMN-binding protein [Vibrio sp. SS-MA-C1-2]
MSCQSCKQTCRSQLNKKEIIGWRFDYSKLFRWLFLITLLFGYWLGQGLNTPNYLSQLQHIYPNSDIIPLEGYNNLWSVKKEKKGKQVFETAILTKENSYGGPLLLVTLYDTKGKITRLDILANNDTPAYIQKLYNHRYLNQFLNKQVIDEKSHQSFDAVSGATISSTAIMRAHYRGLEQASVISFGTQQTLIKQELNLENQHFVLIGFVILALLSQVIKHPAYKLILAIMSLGGMGFWLNQMISVSYFSAVLLGYTPSIYENLSFWIICGSVLVAIIVLGRNIYCGNICPFSALQFLISKLTGLNFPIPRYIKRYGSYLPKFGLWLALFTGLLTTVPIAGTYEPFSMIFSLEGIGIQWAILPIFVIGSVFVPKLFCRYFCPAGQGLDYLVLGRNWLVTLIKRKRTKNE